MRLYGWEIVDLDTIAGGVGEYFEARDHEALVLGT